MGGKRKREGERGILECWGKVSDLNEGFYYANYFNLIFLLILVKMGGVSEEEW